MKTQIKIIANREATSRELSDLENIANSCGLENFFIENSGGSRESGASMPPELLIVIKYSTGALGIGFLRAIGADLWKALKGLVTKSFKYYESPEEGHLYNPDIYIEIKEENRLKLQILFPTRDLTEQQLQKSLEKLNQTLKNHKFDEFSALRFSKGKYLPIRKWRDSKANMMKKNWILGFLGFIGIIGVQGLLAGNYLKAIWLLCFLWFVYFVPKKS